MGAIKIDQSKRIIISGCIFYLKKMAFKPNKIIKKGRNLGIYIHI